MLLKVEAGGMSQEKWETDAATLLDGAQFVEGTAREGPRGPGIFGGQTPRELKPLWLFWCSEGTRLPARLRTTSR